MELAPVGKIVTDPNDLDLGPITVPIIGYKETSKGNVEVVTKIRFARKIPFGFFKDALEKGIDLNAMKPTEYLEYLTVSVLDEDKEKFMELIFGDELYVERATIREVFKVVDEARAGRPTKRPSDSLPSTPATKKTIGRAAPSKAVGASKKSQSRKR
jgi:hypothetical protein